MCILPPTFQWPFAILPPDALECLISRPLRLNLTSLPPLWGVLRVGESDTQDVCAPGHKSAWWCVNMESGLLHTSRAV